jgi:hypothetical protein
MNSASHSIPFLPLAQPGHSVEPVIKSPRVGDITFGLAWQYICCAYFVMPIAGDAAATSFFHFDHGYHFDAINQYYCQPTFNVSMPRTPPVTLRELAANASRIIFSTMGLDPVTAFAVPSSLGESLIHLHIANTAHTDDVCSPMAGEPQDVIDARAKETQILQAWLAAQ